MSRNTKLHTIGIVIVVAIMTLMVFFVVRGIQSESVTHKLQNAQTVAKLSGQYEFSSEINQYTDYAPAITNYGKASRHDQMIISGSINESAQTSSVTIANSQGIVLEIKRERGVTYVRQPGTSWQRSASNNTAQINTLTYLAGVINPAINPQNRLRYDFGFDGATFVAHFNRLLNADSAHGVKYNEEWYALAQSSQFNSTNGNGQLTVDKDGLPASMELHLTQPASHQTGAVKTTIKTTFFGYARTGLALQKMLNNPLTIVGNLFGTDTNSIQTVLYSLLAILLFSIIAGAVHLFRTRLYLPVTMLALGMLVFQPFSTIPQTQAATKQDNAPVPTPGTTTVQPEYSFNPLVSPLQQASMIALPSAGVTRGAGSVVATNGSSRALTTRAGTDTGVDTDKDGLSDEEEKTFGSDPNKVDIDSDGLSDYDEYKLLTNPNKSDSDTDGLSDYDETQIGTNPADEDSDNDGLSDWAEVVTFTKYTGSSNTFYTNPLSSDTNGDGVTDTMECTEKLTTAQEATVNNCTDSNNDNIPDFISFDDDGDAVPDAYDLSPLKLSSTTYTDKSPFTLNITGMTANKPLTVDIQIRPNSAQLLYANGAIYDWPSGDNDGQIIRSKDTTYASSTSLSPSPTDSKSSEGDIQISTSLEIQIPISQGNYGGIPVKRCTTNFITETTRLSVEDPNSCVDTDKIKPYGMSAGVKQTPSGALDRTTATVNVPLSPVYDSTGTIVAYNTQLFYLPIATTTIATQQVRMQWLVSSIQNVCPTDKADCKTDEKIDTLSVITTYYADWKLAGLQATESFGTKTAIIYEDATKPSNTNNTNRRLEISKIADLMDYLFIRIPFFDIDGTHLDKSIPVLFDNLKNSNASTDNYGIDKTATKTFTKPYDTLIDTIKLQAGELPILLDTQLKSTKRADCKNITTVDCRPAAIILIESTSRISSISDNTTSTTITIDQNQDKLTTRTSTGNIYGVNEKGDWYALTTAELGTEYTQIITSVDHSTISNKRPQGFTDAEFEDLIKAMTTTRITAFLEIKTATFVETANVCDYCVQRQVDFDIPDIKEVFKNKKISDWKLSYATELDMFGVYYTNMKKALDQEQSNIKQENTDQDDLEKRQEEAKTLSGSLEKIVEIPLAVSSGLKSGTSTLKNLPQGIRNAWDDLKYLKDSSAPKIQEIQWWKNGLTSGKTFISTVFSKISTASSSVGAVLSGATLIAGFAGADEETLKNLKISASALGFVGAGYEAYTLAKSLKNLSGLYGFKNLIKAAGYAKSVGKLGKVMAGVAIVAVWAIGIMQAVDAEYDYQIGNAIAGAVGQTAAIIILLVISMIPVVGQLIAGIIAVIDALATAICEAVSEKAKRSTAGKLLCGGITGLIANLFTPYAANLIVDPDDEYSHYRDISINDIRLDDTVIGFRTGNGLTQEYKVIDYIERMPFPSTWMSFPYFWQWNDQDETDTSFAYKLGAQVDMSDSIDTGSQTKEWKVNLPCIPTVSVPKPACEFYSDDDKTFSYRRSTILTYKEDLSLTGINAALPDLYLSTAAKADQQTCIAVFNIPGCWIETHTHKPKYVNLNASNKTRFDVFPAKIEEFVTMQAKSNEGFTFAWSPLNASPPFPAFIDADNDGVSHKFEQKYGTSDNNYDTDTDGISDDREIALGTNPSIADNDRDSLSDYQEFLYGTNPNLADSDGDGLLDGEEVIHMDATGTVRGGWQVVYAIRNGVSQATWISSNPNNADGDNDGIGDLREKVLGWSPYAKNSGDILNVNGSVAEAINPLLFTDFENTKPNSPTNNLTTSGTIASLLKCTSTACPQSATFTDRVLGVTTKGLTFTGNQSLSTTGINGQIDNQFTFGVWAKLTGRGWFWYASDNFKFSLNRYHEIEISVSHEKSETIIRFPTQETISQWAHYAVTVNNRLIIVYVDGVELGRHTLADDIVKSKTDTTSFMDRYTGSIDDLALFKIALRPNEIMQLKDGLMPNGNDLIIRPGDRILTSVTTSNKLLGRSMQGNVTVSSASAKNGFQTNQLVTTSMAANANTTFTTVIEAPGQVNTTSQSTPYVNSCVFADTELCVKFAESFSTLPYRFTDTSNNASTLSCTSTQTCPVQTMGTDQPVWEFRAQTSLTTTPAVGNNISNKDFTIAAWVRPDGQETTLRVIANSTNTRTLLQVALNQERPQFLIGSNTPLLLNDKLPLNIWSHVVFTVANGIRSIYVNGKLKGFDKTPIKYQVRGFGALSIGRDLTTNSLNGSIRDLQINSRALDTTQIMALANSCEDPLLLTCLPLTNDTTDWSNYGLNQGVTVTGNSTAGVTLPTSYAELLTNNNFTVVAKFKLNSLTQTVMQTGTANGTGNQFKLWVNGGMPTISMGNSSATLPTTLNTNDTYVISGRYNAGVLSLSIRNSTTLNQSAQTTSSGLLKGQDPVVLGTSGMTLTQVRIYRTALSDATIAAIARYSLFGSMSTTMNQAPVSDQLQINVDAREKIISPEPDFERLKGNCEAATAKLCVPFVDYKFVTARPYTEPTVTASGTAWLNAITDGNKSTPTYLISTSPVWIQLDLGKEMSIEEIAVTMSLKYNILYRTPMVFLMEHDFNTKYAADVFTSYLGGGRPAAIKKLKEVSKNWMYVACTRDEVSNCERQLLYDAGSEHVVTFNKSKTGNTELTEPTKARYILFYNDGIDTLTMLSQLPDQLSIHEVQVATTSSSNSTFGYDCRKTASCPKLDSGGAVFSPSPATYLQLSGYESKQIFKSNAGTQDFTVMTWAKFNDTSNTIVGDRRILYDFGGRQEANKRLSLLVRNSKLLMSYWNNDLEGPILSPNKWYHLTFVQRGDTREIYVDGSLITQDTGKPKLAAASLLLIGTGYDYNKSSFAQSLNGTLRDFQIHKAALSVAQINSAALTRAYELNVPFREPAAAKSFSDIRTPDLGFVCVNTCPLSGVSGRDNTAVRFDGNQPLKLNTAARKYISYVDNPTPKYSIGMWIKPSRYGTQILGSSTNLQATNLAIAPDGRVSLQYVTSKRLSSPIYSASALPLNRWSYVLVNVNGSKASIAINNSTPIEQTVTTPTVNRYSDELWLGETFAGDIDEFTISPESDVTVPATTNINQAPNWELNFEDTLSSVQTVVTNGVTSTTQIDNLVLPNDTPLRSGIKRLQYAARCDFDTKVACPVGNIVGMAGIASAFNGKDTMLQVDNEITLMDEIKNGGTIQMMIKPDNLAITQTVFYYGDGSTNPLHVQIEKGKIKITIGQKSYIASTALPPGWSQLSFSYGTTGFKYYQNGVADDTFKNEIASATFTTNSGYKLRIGGKYNGSTFSEMFRGQIDDIIFTPTTVADHKIYQIARSQFSQTITKSNIAAVTLDADLPVVTIKNPSHVSADGVQFVVNTEDATSSVLTARSQVTANSNSNQAPLDLATPACNDARAGYAYCPTFVLTRTNPNTQIEGKYTITASAVDAVGNIGITTSTILVDTTPPIVALVRPTVPYTATRSIDELMPSLQVRLTATDPVLVNSSESAGSGVASLSVNIKDSSGRTVNQQPIPAVLVNGTWRATIPLPFANPSGYYTIGAIASDAVGNKSSEIMVTGANPIEVDGSAPSDVIVSPSPYDPNQYFVSNQAITGRISDQTDGRTALQQNLRVRLDFEAPDGADAFDNRADRRYNTSCTICPIIAQDTTDTSKRVARFNIDNSVTAQQSLTIANAATVLTGTFSIAFMAKINDTGTLISTGVTSNPRLRIQVTKVGSAFQVAAKKGSTSVSTPPTLASNTWYYFIYSEYRDGTTSKISLAYGSNLTNLVTPATKDFTGALPPVQANIIIGAMQSSSQSNAQEDYFRGSVDDIILSPLILVATDLQGKSITNGSGIQSHQTRLSIQDDGMTMTDGLANIADLYMSMNQPDLPLVDIVNQVQSSACVANRTIGNNTCPKLVSGFSGNAITFNQATDGIQTGYQLQSSVGISRSLALRFKINPDATPGLLVSLQAPPSNDSLAMQVMYDNRRITIRLNDKSTTFPWPEATTEINDTYWHTLVVTSVATNSDEQLSLYIDGTLLTSKLVAGHWNGAVLGLGALTGAVTSPSGSTDVAWSEAATNTVIDDVAVFNRALTIANINDYSFNYSTVYHATFDDTNVVNGAITVDASPYHQPSLIRSGDAYLTSVSGAVGTGALMFDGNDAVIHRDLNTLTFAPHDQPWSLSTWVKPANAGGSATIVNGTLNSYGYELSLTAGKPKFTMAGTTVTGVNQLSTIDTSHIVISSNGTTVTMYVNGTSVASSATSAGSNAFNRTLAVIPFATKQQSTTASSDNDATKGYDNNLTTYALTTPETNPYWVASNTISTPIDSVTIYSEPPTVGAFSPLKTYTLFVSDTLPDMTKATDRVRLVKAESKWSYHSDDAINNRVIIPLPNGITGKYVIIIAEGDKQTLALNEVRINQVPTITIGAGFSGMIDDVRIYRRALDNQDMSRLNAMAWKPSVLTTTDGYTTWQRLPINGIEVDASIQSMTSDKNGNSQLSSGETSLWSGSIDTSAPRVTANNTNGTYSVTANDRNIDDNQILTPCGNTLQVSVERTASLWFMQYISTFVNSALRIPTTLTGTCTLPSNPEVISTNNEVISPTTALVYGSRYAYVGGNNRINTADVSTGQPMFLRATPVQGNVTLLKMNHTKQKLYALSTNNTQSFLTIYDVATNPLAPAQIGILLLEFADKAILDMAINSANNGDLFVQLLTTGINQSIISIDVTNANLPIRATETLLTQQTYDIDARYDLVGLAQGAAGVSINQIVASDGKLDAQTQFSTTAFVHKISMDDTNLYVIEDEEPYENGIAPTSANTIRTIPLIATISNNQAVLVTPLAERNFFRHETAGDADDVDFYHIQDVVAYTAQTILLLSSAVTKPNTHRISILAVGTSEALLRSDTLVTADTMQHVASNGQFVTALSRTGATTNLLGYQISDSLLGTTVCDRRNNCTTVTTTSNTQIALGQTPPAQSSVRFLNQTTAFTSANQSIYVSGESAQGITRLDLRANNVVVASISLPDAPQRYEAQFNVSLPSGSHELTATMTDSITTTTSESWQTAVDLQSPQIAVLDMAVSNLQIVNNMIQLRMVITDDVALDNLQIINKRTNTNMPFTTKQRGKITDVSTSFYRDTTNTLQDLPLQIIATDGARRTTTIDRTIRFDILPPVVSDGGVNAKINGSIASLKSEQLITNGTNIDLHAAWSKITDESMITLSQLEYTKKDVTGTNTYSTTIPVTGVSVPAGRVPSIATSEASRMSFAIRLRDALNNGTTTSLSSVYIDTPLTPDYTLMESGDPTYRGFISNGCAILGEDRRPAVGIQQFAMTWDAQSLRLNWQGADWEYDGDLFIYLDTTAGGTIKTYRPTSYTQTITDSIASGAAYITLPVNTAARSASVGGTSLANYVNSFQTNLIRSQKGIRANTIQGSDYVIYVPNRSVAKILRWDETSDAWIDANTAPIYQYVNELGIKQTDIRALFSQIGYTVGNPIGVVAFATASNKFMPWATFPSTNPIGDQQADKTIAITPMLNGYGWDNLAAGVCPNTIVRNPDTTHVIASLTSNPSGATNRAIADNFTNTEPDAIAQIINDTSELCTANPTYTWCNTVAQYANTNNTGSALLDGLSRSLIANQTPLVGNGSVVTYTFSIQNTTNKPTRTLYGIVQTYGGVWLTDGNTTGITTTITGGGNYDYHNISTPGLRDYLLIKIPAIPANGSQRINLRALIDTNKAQSSTADRIKTTNIAKVEIRLTDSGSTSNIDQARTVEWLNAAVNIDAQAPSQIVPDNQSVVPRGKITLTGRVTDASSVSTVTIEYYTDANPNRQQINCGRAVNGRWACPITVAPNVNNLTYRFRASDIYKQQTNWTAWYGSTVDSTPPSFNISSATQNMIDAAYVGGDSININGTLLDIGNTATAKICDESQAGCETASASDTAITFDSNTSSFTQTSSPNSVITTGLCSTSETSTYSAFPVTISNATSTQRIDNLTIEVKLNAAQSEDVNLWLKSPSGTLVRLLTSVRSTTGSIHPLFTDDAILTTTNLTSTTNLNGNAIPVHPDGNLSDLRGEAINGDWRLLACDKDATNNSGTLVAWTLSINSIKLPSQFSTPWQYTLQNTSNLDSVMRMVTLWGIDTANNPSPSITASFNIDTVAPQLNITQLGDTILADTQATLFQGGVSEGGTLPNLTANIYDDTSFVKALNVELQSVQSQEVARWNYLLNRTISNYTWQLPFDATALPSGTYKVQFVAIDAVGNRRTSASYAITIPAVGTPAVSNITQRTMDQSDAIAFDFDVATGNGSTQVVTTIDFDSTVTAPITDTTLMMWNSNGITDTVAQDQITTTLQSTLFNQLDMNDHLAAALKSNGTLTTWALKPTNTITVTAPISNVVQLPNIAQFAMGASSNQHLLTLSTTGVITDYTPSGAVSVPITNAVMIAAGTSHNLAILKTGKLMAWGDTNSNGETTIPLNARMGVSQIAAGAGFSLALKSDGRIVAWGKNNYGQTTIPVSATTSITQIAAGDNHGLALRTDGRVIAWGDNSAGQTTVPVTLTNAIVIAIVANANSSAVITQDGQVYVWGATRSVTNCCLGTSTIALNATQILTNQMSALQIRTQTIAANRNAVPIATNFSKLILGRRYRYTITVSTAVGSNTYTSTFTAQQNYSQIYLPLLTNTSGATAVNSTSGK
jgi:hypothetical protein